MFFMGTYTPKLDEKGRLFLPAKFRDALAEGLVITQGQDNCLTVWPEQTFMAEAARAQATPMTNKDARDYRRVLFAGAEQGTPDKQGRIGIPTFLRASAGLERDVVVVSHDAFGYLGDRYGLDIHGIAGLSPDAEPGPADIAELQELIDAEGVTTVFSETLVSPATAETLAQDAGVGTDVLDPLEGLSDETADEDYLSIMRSNLASLQEANGCQ